MGMAMGAMDVVNLVADDGEDLKLLMSAKLGTLKLGATIDRHSWLFSCSRKFNVFRAWCATAKYDGLHSGSSNTGRGVWHLFVVQHRVSAGLFQPQILTTQ